MKKYDDEDLDYAPYTVLTKGEYFHITGTTYRDIDSDDEFRIAQMFFPRGQGDFELRQQTEAFWLFQLQMLELPSYTLKSIFTGLRQSGTYRTNDYTRKMEDICQRCANSWYIMAEEDRMCLATHIALQMAGIEE
jgi:hypothetical protein